MPCLVATHLRLRGRNAYAMIPPSQTENGYLRKPRHARVAIFSDTDNHFYQNPTSACGSSPQNTAIGILLALRLYTSGLLTCPYYHVLYQLKNRAETTEGKTCLPAIPRGYVGAQAIEAPDHARSQAMHLQATTMLS